MRQQAAARWAMSEIQTDTPQKFAESFERYLAGVTEVADLAQMELWLDDEMECESSHECVGGRGDGGCSVVVAYRLVWPCGLSGAVCSNRAAYFEFMNPIFVDRGYSCPQCGGKHVCQIIPV